MADWPYNTKAWKRLRLAKLAHDPLCHPCTLRGRIVPAHAVDHVVSIASGGEPFPALDKLMSLCTGCHSHKTAGVDRHDRHSNGRRFKGHDADGNPIDPSDDWHGGPVHHQNGTALGPMPSSNKYILDDNDYHLEAK